MHPPLIPDKHPLCKEYMEALVRCHKEHSVAKWWGACNDPKFALTKCLSHEKVELRAERQARAKEQWKQKRAQDAAKAQQQEEQEWQRGAQQQHAGPT